MDLGTDSEILNEILNQPPVVILPKKKKKNSFDEEDEQWLRDNKIDYLKKKTDYLEDEPSSSSTSSSSSSSSTSSSSPLSSSFSIEPQIYRKLSEKYKKGADSYLQSPQSPKINAEEIKDNKEDKKVAKHNTPPEMVPGDDVFLNELLKTDGNIKISEEGKLIDEEWARIDKEKARLKIEDERLDENFERMNRGQRPVGFTADGEGNDGIDEWRAYFRAQEETVVTAKRHVLYDIEKVNTRTRAFNMAVRGMGRASEVRKIKTMVYLLNEDQLTPLPYGPGSSSKH